MESVATAGVHHDVARRAAPIATAAALLGATAFLATHDPAAGSSPFPSCAFHQVTGLWCPGCGLTRGVHQLLHGHLGSAISYNVFTPFVVVIVVLALGNWLRSAWTGRSLRWPTWAGRWTAVTVPALVIVYGVLRNLPVAPLRALAP